MVDLKKMGITIGIAAALLGGTVATPFAHADNAPRLNRELQIGFSVGPGFLMPAGFMFSNVYPEYFILKNLALGFNFSSGWYEGGIWALNIDILNVKYAVVPKNIRNLSMFLRTGFGLALGIQRVCVDVGWGITQCATGTGLSFDWIFSGGVDYWLTRTVALTGEMVVHTWRGEADMTFFNLLGGIKFNMGF